MTGNYGEISLYRFLYKCNSMVVVSRSRHGGRRLSFPKLPHLVSCTDVGRRTANCGKVAGLVYLQRDESAPLVRGGTREGPRDPADSSNRPEDAENEDTSRAFPGSSPLHPYHAEFVDAFQNGEGSPEGGNRYVGSKASNENAEKLPKSRGRGSPMRRRAREPDILFCYICGHQFGRTSLPFHERECLKKWKHLNDRRQISRKRTPPVKIAFETTSSIWNLNLRQRKELHWKMYLQNRPACRFCHRRFSHFKIDSHEDVCQKLVHKKDRSPAKLRKLRKLKSRNEIANRFSISRSPLLSLISRMKVIAAEPAGYGRRVIYPSSRKCRSKSASKRRRTVGSVRTRQAVASAPRKKASPRTKRRHLPRTKLLDLKSKIERWQSVSSWEESEEIMRLKKKISLAMKEDERERVSE